MTENASLDMGRRKFVAYSALSLLLGPSLFAKSETKEFDIKKFLEGDRELTLSRANGKHYSILYYKDGEYIRSAYEDLCYLSMDIRAKEAVEMDANLFNIMHFSQKWFDRQLGKRTIIRLTSGYRSTQTNNTTEGAARNSYHTKGKGIDYSIDGVKQYHTAYCSRYFGAGGVGIYSTHTHIDTGEERAWIR